MAYLDDHPPARRQFYCPRRDGTQPSGVIVVHDAENVTDAIGPDTGAEAVARFIATRDTPGSYHDLVDSDSIIQLVRYECEAFHDATGTNRHSYGVSGAYRHSDWLGLPQTYRDRMVVNMARAARGYADWLKVRRGIVIPAKRISVAAARNRVPGFISHAELDPARRTDPGPHFPWTQFLTIFAEGAPTPEVDMQADERAWLKALYDQSPKVWNELGIIKAAIAGVDADVDEAVLAQAILAGLNPEQIGQAVVAAIGPELAQDVVTALAAELAD